jgi:hypothetical protein
LTLLRPTYALPAAEEGDAEERAETQVRAAAENQDKRAAAATSIAATSELVLPPGLQPTTVIDLLIERGWQDRQVTPSPRCSDATFVRRIYLDLVGRIPTRDEARRFRADTESDKRRRLIDTLLESPEYGRHMSNVFDAFLMGRRGAEKQDERRNHGWLDYLENGFNENRAWNEMARDILLARPVGQTDHGAVWFLYERKNKHQDIAEAIAPGFFGVQVQCAQCHDHPLAAEIEQRHYWGLVAFYNRGKNVNTDAGPRISESAIGGFAKFTDLSGMANDAQLTFLGKSLVVPEIAPVAAEKSAEDATENYVDRDANGRELNPRVPKFSRREQFVEQIVNDNPLVARALVNRLWALLLGRGIVHPVDMMDSNHAPSHPRLLDWLARDFADSGYNIKRLVRQIVSSRTYHLDARRVGAGTAQDSFAWALQKPLNAESLYRSMLVAVDGSLEAEDEDALNSFRDIFPEVFPEENVSVLKQSLFLSNNPALQQIVSARPGSVLTQLLTRDDNQTIVRTTFEATFGRQPDEDELIACTEFLSERTEHRHAAVSQLIWALLTSAEFRFNH